MKETQSNTYSLLSGLMTTSVEVTTTSVSCDTQVSNGIFFLSHLHVIRNRSVENCLPILKTYYNFFKKKGIPFFLKLN